MKRLLALAAAIASAAVFASAEDLPPASLPDLAKGFTQSVRFTFSKNCRDASGFDCDKGTGNPLAEDLGDGPEVVVDGSGNFVVRRSDGIWIVQPDGTSTKLAELPAPACQMSSPTSAVQTRLDVYAVFWNGPLNALFVTTVNQEFTTSFNQAHPDYCKNFTVTGGYQGASRVTFAMVQVDYPAAGSNAAFSRRGSGGAEEAPFRRAQRLPVRIRGGQPDYSTLGANLFRSSRRLEAGAR